MKTSENRYRTISQDHVPEGRYDIRIEGEAVGGVGTVELAVTASTTMTVGSDGYYVYSYGTGSIQRLTVEYNHKLTQPHTPARSPYTSNSKPSSTQ